MYDYFVSELNGAKRVKVEGNKQPFRNTESPRRIIPQNFHPVFKPSSTDVDSSCFLDSRGKTKYY